MICIYVARMKAKGRNPGAASPDCAVASSGLPTALTQENAA